jgi:transcriptional regulator with XRE-family HTH domain
MPRRAKPDPFSLAIGKRIQALRVEIGLTLEDLAYESDLGSKGHLSDIEHGRVRPTTATLKTIADRLEVRVLDLVNFPEEDDRAALVDITRRLPSADVKRVLRELRASARP